MAQNGPPFGSTEQARETTVAYPEQTLWQRLLEADSDIEFCHSWLGLQSRVIGGVFSGLVLLGPDENGSFSPVALWPREIRRAGHLKGIAERVLSSQKGVVIRNDADASEESSQELRFHIGYPVKIREALYGAAVLEIAFREQGQLQTAMRQLQWGMAWLQNLVIRKQAEPEARKVQRLTAALELAAAALQEDGFKDAALALVTLLATRLGCDRVSIGFVEGKQVKVQALSHSAQFEKEMNLIHAIGAAMDEGLDQRRVLVYPEAGEADSAILRAHGELAHQYRDFAICTIPFVHKDGKAFGALTLERSAERVFDSETVTVCEAVAALAGPILEEKRQNSQPLARKAWQVLESQLERLVGPGHMAIKTVASGLLLLTVFFSFAMGDHRVSAISTIEGTVKRAIVAPFNGYIFDAPVRAGDVVTEGTVMCSLDDRDLRLERLKWAGQREQHYLESLDAMTKGDAAKAKIAAEQMNQAEAQLLILDEQLSRTSITAPFRGLVVTGDLSQSLAAPVERGQVLFEVAPLDSYRVKLDVDEHDISSIKVGQPGTLILASLPGDSFSFLVEKITPVSKPFEGRNTFVVEAQLSELSERLRPGMEGYGKILAGREKLIWIWTHELIDWARLKLWAWTP